MSVVENWIGLSKILYEESYWAPQTPSTYSKNKW